MRDILFRGKRKDTGEWVEGYFWKDICGDGESCYILYDGEDYEVGADTVGQYIGETDKNRQRIFEGDIVQTNEGNWIGAVVYQGCEFFLEDSCGFFSSRCPWTEFEVLGNIFDNPELLEAGQDV